MRATAMTRMYNQGVPEKLIAKKSGHRSVDGFRVYEHTASEVQKAASEFVSDPSKSFIAQMHKQEPLECVPVVSLHDLQIFQGFLASIIITEARKPWKYS